MSKQTEAKEKQGYTRYIKDCGNCRFLDCSKPNSLHTSKGLRCGIGGFVVFKTATCNKHERK